MDAKDIVTRVGAKKDFQAEVNFLLLDVVRMTKNEVMSLIDAELADEEETYSWLVGKFADNLKARIEDQMQVGEEIDDD